MLLRKTCHSISQRFQRAWSPCHATAAMLSEGRPGKADFSRMHDDKLNRSQRWAWAPAEPIVVLSHRLLSAMHSHSKPGPRAPGASNYQYKLWLNAPAPVMRVANSLEPACARASLHAGPAIAGPEVARRGLMVDPQALQKARQVNLAPRQLREGGLANARLTKNPPVHQSPPLSRRR